MGFERGCSPKWGNAYPFSRWSFVEKTLDCQDCHLGVLSHVAAYIHVYQAMGDTLIAFSVFKGYFEGCPWGKYICGVAMKL